MKTIEEAAIENWEKDFGKGNEGHFLFKQSTERFKGGVEFAQSWISVEDELPVINEEINNSEEIITKDIFGSYDMGNCRKNGKDFKFFDYYGNEIENVTHWRPIELKP